ncbi:response regulator [Streptomyces sp. NPDC005492]|uniref:response regulator transcription factor n=1 Tax=Streptomyces sp. NPDC005492 TaxID=3156883 RepID=UPI0033A4075A
MGRSVLVVDDDPAYRAAVRALLEADGAYAVSEAASASAAVTEIARGDRPDLVLLDLGLPGEDVFATVRELKALAADVVIVLCSVRGADEFGGRIACSPAAGFLPKAGLSAAALSRFAATDGAGHGRPCTGGEAPHLGPEF